MKKLGIIPVFESDSYLKGLGHEENPYAIIDENIIIDYSQDIPILCYKTSNISNGRYYWNRIDGDDSPIRSSRMSDLEYYLRKADWNLSPRKAIKYLPEKDESVNSSLSEDRKNPILYVSSEKEWSNPIISIDDSPELDNFYVVSDYFNSKETIDIFNSYYEILMNTKPMNYIYNPESNESVNLGSIYYFNLISSRNLDSGSTIIDLLSLNDSNYTSTLNLTSLVNLNSINGDRKIKGESLLTVGIEYSISGKRYIKEIVFTPFKKYFTENSEEVSKIESLDFVHNILDYVSIDYHDYCLRVFPISLDVNECIISYCSITYD